VEDHVPHSEQGIVGNHCPFCIHIVFVFHKFSVLPEREESSECDYLLVDGVASFF
jgi:hypothetical protein